MSISVSSDIATATSSSKDRHATTTLATAGRRSGDPNNSGSRSGFCSTFIDS